MAGQRAAILAGIGIATSFGFMAHHGARSGELDAPLTLLLFLAFMLASWMFESRAARLALGLILSLAFLLKSFAIIPFVAALGLYGLITRGMASWRAWVLPVFVPVVVVVTWAVARNVAEGSTEFVRRMFLEDLLLRSTTAIDPDRPSWWDYVGALVDRQAPWPLLVLIAWGLSGKFAQRRLSGDFSCLLWCFCLVPLVLFTLARTHHSHYIIPLYPAWAILGAVATMEVLRAVENTPWRAPVAWLLLMCVLACQVRLIMHVEVHDRLSPGQIFLTSLQERIQRGTVLYTSFTPSYSERFFLQATDGLELRATPLDLRSPVHGLVLVKKSATGLWTTPPLTNAVVLTQQQDYALVRTP
jgi:4-amino-4-deoxy-L-arabinose transferase-like glycosyltransferase